MPPPVEASRVVRRAPALGACIGAACTLLTVLAAALVPPRLLGSVLGPPPFPAVLAAASLVTGVGAGALVGRRASRLGGPGPRRLGRIALFVGVGYLGAVTAAVVGMSVAEQGPTALAFPFQLVAHGLTAGLLLAPWAALPLTAGAVALERLTRPARSAARAHGA